MSKRSDNLLIKDMIESGEKIQTYINGLNFDEFMLDNKTKDAVVRNFEIIGEAANRITKKFKEQYTDIDWKQIIGFRNRIVHEYFGIDFEIVWQIQKTYLPEMLEKLRRITV
jgi:uncharacterized protein with HEPN domain